MESELTDLALAVFAVLLVLYSFSSYAPSFSFPGPCGIPVIGNLAIFVNGKPWDALAQLKHRYGPLVSIRLLGTPVLVLNDTNVARELLEKKSSLYSNRPLTKMVKLSGMDRGILLEHDPGRLRHGRRLAYAVLHANRLSQWRETQEYHTRALLQNFVIAPSHFLKHIHLFSTAILLEITHGHRVENTTDPFMEKMNHFTETIAEMGVLQYAVDWIPALAKLPTWFPGTSFRDNASRCRDIYFNTAEEGHRMVKEQIEAGIARPSLVGSALLEGACERNPDDIIMFSATQVVAGGGDTTYSFLASLILLMIIHPEVQRRAQEEINQIVGKSGLPTHSHMRDLPFTNAVVAEVMRLRPPVSIMFREAAEDDIHDNRLVFKGTMLLVNIWGMLHDESVYSEPHAFKPERWLDLSAPLPKSAHPFDIAFGFSRRICPGKALAQEMLTLAAARILAAFDLACARDTEGREIRPSQEMMGGGVTCPVPFECVITPRPPWTAEVLGESFDTFCRE